MIEKKEATCPHCGNKQPEPTTAISTICRSCGQSFYLQAQGRRGERRETRPTAPPVRQRRARQRRVTCRACNWVNTVYEDTPYVDCENCDTRIDFDDVTISDDCFHQVITHGVLNFLPQCNYRAHDAVAYDAIVQGTVATRLEAEREIRICRGSTFHGELHAPTIILEPGTKVIPERIEAINLEVRGILHCERIVVRERLTVGYSGEVEALTELLLRRLEIEKGARLRTPRLVTLSPEAAQALANAAKKKAKLRSMQRMEEDDEEENLPAPRQAPERPTEEPKSNGESSPDDQVPAPHPNQSTEQPSDAANKRPARPERPKSSSGLSIHQPEGRPVLPGANMYQVPKPLPPTPKPDDSQRSATRGRSPAVTPAAASEDDKKKSRDLAKLLSKEMSKDFAQSIQKKKSD